MNPVGTCKLCGSSSSRVVRRGLRHAPEQEVRECETCGLVFQSPLPTEAQLERYYRLDYRRDYSEPSLEERYEIDQPDAVARVCRLVPLLHAGSRLLEIGSGSGAFLEAIAPHVGRAIGVEPEDAARAWLTARGTQVVPMLEDADAERFDAIVLFHVLEHVLDPVNFIKALTPYLAPGGRVVVEVPNIDDALVAVYHVRSYLPFYYQKAHLFYFSAKTLAEVFRLAQFQTEITGVQRYGLGNHLYWMLAGKPGGQGRYSEVLTPEVQQAYAESLVQRGHSDTLWAIAHQY